MRTPTTILTALTVALFAAGCGAKETPAAAPVTSATPAAAPAQPKTVAAAKKAAAEYLDLYAAGEYGASWDEWVSSAKKLITRQQYEKLHELCPPVAAAIPFKVSRVRLVGTTAIVGVSRVGVAATVRFRYEGGRWRWVPLGAGMQDYKRLHSGATTVKKLAAQKRVQGACET